MACQELRSEDAFHFPYQAGARRRVVPACAQADGVSLPVLAKTPIGVAAILKSLAEGEVELCALILRQARICQRRLHRRNVVVIEAERLEVGEGPPSLPVRRGVVQGAPIGVDGPVLIAFDAQQVAQADPCGAVLGGGLGKLAVSCDRCFGLAQLRKSAGLQG